MLKRDRLSFWLAYLRDRAPWDTNVTPPELMQTIEGPGALPSGRALDLGCGTGTNVIYLAQRGWEAVGVDFVKKAIRRARKKAHLASVPARFFWGDVTQLDRVDGLDGRFDLALDIGCFHALTPDGRTRYAVNVVDRLRPGATFLLYAREQFRDRKRGVKPEQVTATFAPHLRVACIQPGEERGRRSAWYWLKRLSDK